MTTDNSIEARNGRPKSIPRIEAARGIRIEHYVMDGFAAGRSLAQMAASLRIHADTLRSALRRRGYRVDRNTRLVRIDSPDQGEGGRRARGTAETLGAASTAPEQRPRPRRDVRGSRARRPDGSGGR